MWIEWCCLAVLGLIAFGAILGRARSPAIWALAFGSIALTAAAGVFLGARWQRTAVAAAKVVEKAPRQEPAGGYTTSDTCQACHPNQYSSWHRSFHRTMTQYANPGSVRGKFDGTPLTVGGEVFRFYRREDAFWVQMPDPDFRYQRQMEMKAFRQGRAPAPSSTELPRVDRQVGLLTGSHHMQAYWVPSRFGNSQHSLPFVYLFEEERWVPRNDVFLLKPDSLHLQQIWNATCIACHATVGQPRQDPKSNEFSSQATELGISCEACHGPGEEHVRANANPARRYALHRSGQADRTIVNPARQDHVRSSQTCGQCHAARNIARPADWRWGGLSYKPGEDLEICAPVTRYEERFAGGPDSQAHKNQNERLDGTFWSDGLVRVSGRDYNGLIESACFKKGELSCVSCHSLHQYIDTDDQLAPTKDGNAACLQCHGSMALKLEQHTHHAPGSSGSLCYNCHMPHTSYGLLKAIRSHTVHSPSVRATRQTGRPHACNLCHLDRSLGWTQARVSEWYGTPREPLTSEEETVSAALLWLLKGDAGQRALIAWHMGWEPAMRVSGSEWLAPFLAETLKDSYAVVRYIGQRSLKRLPGFREFSYDYIGPVEARANAQRQAVEIWQKRAISGSRGSVARSEILLDADGKLRREAMQELLGRRDDHPMELWE